MSSHTSCCVVCEKVPLFDLHNTIMRVRGGCVDVCAFLPSGLVRLTPGDALQPVLLRHLHDEWGSLTDNICFSSAARTGAAVPARTRSAGPPAA